MDLRVTYQQRKSIARLLLLAGYLVFFATQFNGKFYTASNFFVYKGGNTVIKGSLRQDAGHNQVYHVDAHRPAHLSMDKRFSFRAAIKPVFADLQAPVPSYIIITRKALPPPVVYFSHDLPTNALRGPPTA